MGYAHCNMQGSYDDKQGPLEQGWCVDQIFTLKQIGEKAQETKCRVYVGFIDLEKVYNSVNMEGLWQVLRIYDVGGKLLGGIKNMHVNSSGCVRVKGGESGSEEKLVGFCSASLFPAWKR